MALVRTDEQLDRPEDAPRPHELLPRRDHTPRASDERGEDLCTSTRCTESAVHRRTAHGGAVHCALCVALGVTAREPASRMAVMPMRSAVKKNEVGRATSAARQTRPEMASPNRSCLQARRTPSLSVPMGDLCHTWCMASAVHLVAGARCGSAPCVALWET